MLVALVVVFPAFGFAQAAWIKKNHAAAYAKLTDAIAG